MSLIVSRRGFLGGLLGATTALVLPYEPERVYSFGPEVGRIHIRGTGGRLVLSQDDLWRAVAGGLWVPR